MSPLSKTSRRFLELLNIDDIYDSVDLVMGILPQVSRLTKY